MCGDDFSESYFTRKDWLETRVWKFQKFIALTSKIFSLYCEAVENNCDKGGTIIFLRNNI